MRTLDISAKRIEYFHSNRLDAITNTPLQSRHGTHAKKQLPMTSVQSVHDHIKSFPKQESHYCRASTARKYLDASLSVQKMYELYCEDYDVPPVKLHKYREIFNTEFNLGFQLPRNDRCDRCEEFKMNQNPSEDDSTKFAEHANYKLLSKANRDSDRSVIDNNHAIICIDLQNVLTLPHANVKSFFFSRKLSVYNFTGHCSLDSTGYCAVWPESTAGRTGNDMASACVAILNKIAEKHTNISKITLWSDSCVAQNRNSVMTLALLKFLSQHNSIQQINQKFGAPGHSVIQEVDNIHSQIEKKMRNSEIYSPVGLLRLLKHVNSRKPFDVIQMKRFTDYHSKARFIHFDIPFTKVKEIVYRQPTSDVMKLNIGSRLQTNLPAYKSVAQLYQVAGPYNLFQV